MERESFESQTVAKVLNENFVSIKASYLDSSSRGVVSGLLRVSSENPAWKSYR